MKLKLLALAALAVVSSSSFAAMEAATSGNGELLANFRFYSGASNDVGGDDMSALFDLGVTMDSFLANRNVSGFTQTWNLNASNYGSAWSALQTFAGASAANIEFNVIALDNTNPTTSGGSRYMTTAAVNTFPALSNNGLTSFQNMNSYVVANQSRGTHATQTNGASTGTSLDASNVYFGKVNGGNQDGDNWATVSPTDTTAKVAVAQNFYFLQSSSATGSLPTTKLAFGYDLDGNGTLGATELGKWTVNAAAGTITFTNPAAVPEPETYAMLLAGLGLIGSIVRRRSQASA